VRVTLLHNPRAGDGSDPDTLIRLIEHQGHAVRYAEAREGAKEWERALAEPADLVAVAGGDGSVAKAARALADRGVTFTVLPFGTANNVATSLGIGADAERAITSWPRWRTSPHDMGVATWDDGAERRFVESCGGGLFGDAIRHANQRGVSEQRAESAIEDALALFETSTHDAAPRDWRIAIDGVERTEALLAIEVMLVPIIGPNIPLASADTADGRFTIVRVREDDRAPLREALGVLRRGERPSLALGAESAQFVSIAGGPLHVDDAIVEDRGRVALAILPGALTVLRP